MKISNVGFVGSYEHEHQCPKDGRHEYAFIGRSNVGKSSLINMLTGRKSLARVSNTPGKTQTLNFFTVDDEWYLVDPDKPIRILGCSARSVCNQCREGSRQGRDIELYWRFK